MDNHQPIGIFDSGVGGLSVLAHVHHLLPAEHIIYVADAAYMPYGSLHSDTIRERCHHIAGFFTGLGAKAMVVACNTATAVAIDELRQNLQIPVIGMEPAVKPAVEATRAGIVGVLATSGTLASEKFSRLVKRFNRNVEVVFQSGSGLVEQVESGDFNGEKTRELLRKHLTPLLERGVDTLVLGCTHYPFLTPMIREIAGEGIVVLETGPAIARELKRQLSACATSMQDGVDGSVSFFSSGEIDHVQQMISRLWGSHVEVKSLEIKDDLDRW